MRALLLLPLGLVAACGPPDPERVMRQCEDRARAAQGPTGRVAVGANSEDGRFASVAIGVTGDYLAGRDPIEVYERCVLGRTGALPPRPPVLN